VGGVIILTAEVERRNREEGERGWPNECCGFVLGALEDGAQSGTRTGERVSGDLCNASPAQAGSLPPVNVAAQEKAAGGAQHPHARHRACSFGKGNASPAQAGSLPPVNAATQEKAAGGGKRADFVLPVENNWEAGERYHRFVISPEDFMRAEREARRVQKEILGIYHSHPDHPARPSDYDREQALPFYSYLIVSVRGPDAADGAGACPKVAELTSWELSDTRDQFLEEEITLWR
jgi:proteasome lid subunit RPN8/RPN11